MLMYANSTITTFISAAHRYNTEGGSTSLLGVNCAHSNHRRQGQRAVIGPPLLDMLQLISHSGLIDSGSKR